ncbi:hypothetical protein FSP39_018934 [Pinctada imbricata]|uniref:Uncharacterized protein n=1 Tax=Pinctada imbricata TaxID=66713 RepID=A0AA88YGR6_PINIB|nr:hypothetical protein FSP39_018934 [Pinctada imbricata]
MVREIVNLNLNGQVFRLPRSTFLRLPSQCFDETLESSADCDEYFLERHADSFTAILWYFTNGELHMPDSVCPSVFKRELEFWSIEPSRMSRCCYMKYVSFFEDQALLKTFEEDETRTKGIVKPTKIGSTRWERFRRQVWTILDDPSSGITAKMYVVVSAFFILLSIFVLSASTHPSFQRPLDIREWAEYFNNEPEIQQQFEEGLVEIITTKNGNSEKLVIRRKNKERKVIQSSEYSLNKSGSAEDMLERFNLTQYLKNQTNGMSKGTRQQLPESRNFTEESLPNNTVTRFRFLDVIDYCMVTYFATELAIRFLFCPRKSKFFASFLNIIDLVALSSESCIMLFEYLFPKEKFTTFSPLDIVECIQIARVFRLCRLVKNFIGFRILVYSVRASLKNILLMIFNMVVAALIFSSVVFYCDRSAFTSIPDAIWWSIVTMTTVGYGDVFPSNAPGRLIGCLCAISGVFVLAVSIPVLVNNFLLFTGFARIPIKRQGDDLASMLQVEFDISKQRQNGDEREKEKILKSLPS